MPIFTTRIKMNLRLELMRKNNSYEFTIQALSEVMALLCSGLHHSIHGLDIIAHWLNEQYLAAHLQEVFGQEVLTINHLRELSGLSKSQSPVSSISNYAGPLSLEKNSGWNIIMNGYSYLEDTQELSLSHFETSIKHWQKQS